MSTQHHSNLYLDIDPNNEHRPLDSNWFHEILSSSSPSWHASFFPFFEGPEQNDPVSWANYSMSTNFQNPQKNSGYNFLHHWATFNFSIQHWSVLNGCLTIRKHGSCLTKTLPQEPWPSAEFVMNQWCAWDLLDGHFQALKYRYPSELYMILHQPQNSYNARPSF